MMEIPDDIQAAVKATPCARCNERGGYRLEVRYEMTGGAALGGLSVREWPWVVCDLCGFEERAHES